MKKMVSALLCGAMVLSVAGCGGKQETPAQTTAAQTTAAAASEIEATEAKGTGVPLVVYGNTSEEMEEWTKNKAAEAGFNLQFVGGGVGDIQTRLIAEKGAPFADVVWGLNGIVWATLKSEDCLEAYVPTWADKVSPGLNDPDGYFHAFGKQAILLAYDKNQLAPEEAP